MRIIGLHLPLLRLACCLLPLLVGPGSARAEDATTSNAATSVVFNRDIRPILSDNCFACHGPDATARQADLRLDVRDAAVAAGAIVPGAPEGSPLLQRILTHDPEQQMPPPRANTRQRSNR